MDNENLTIINDLLKLQKLEELRTLSKVTDKTTNILCR